MKRWKTMLGVGLVGMLLAAMAAQAGAQATAVAPKQLLDEAKKLYVAHNYDGAMKRLQQVDRTSLGLLERGSYDSLLKETQKAVEGKAIAEKAFVDGKDALEKNRFGTAVEKLTVAASSDYLEDDKAGPAQGLLLLANDANTKALAQARDDIAKAQAAVKAGKADEAAALVKDVKAMDVTLSASDRALLASLDKSLVALTKPAEKPVAVAAVPVAASRPLDIAPVMKPSEKALATMQPILVASAVESAPAAPIAPTPAPTATVAPVAPAPVAPAPAPVAPAPAPVAPAPAPVAPVVVAPVAPTPAPTETVAPVAPKAAATPTVAPAAPKATASAAAPAPSANDLFGQAKKAYDDRKFADAQKLLQKTDRSQLGFFDKMSYDNYVKDTQTAIDGQAADEKSLANGKDALTKKRYAAAMAQLDKAASSKYLATDKVETAKTMYATAKSEDAKATAQAKDMLAQAKADLSNGKTADAAKLVDQIKAMDVDLGWMGNNELASLDKKIKVVEAEAAGAGMKPTAVAAATPTAPKAAAPKAASTMAVAAVKPTPTMAVAVATKTPTGTLAPVVPVTPKAVGKGGAALAPEAAVSLAAQARHAEAEDAVKLGNDFLAQREYEQAKVQFLRAMNLWPEAPDAKEGLDKAMKFTGERDESLQDVVRERNKLERERIIAAIQEQIGQAEAAMGRAKRPEDYVEAERPPFQAERTIETARVLSPEEAERYREEVLVLKNDIKARRDSASGKRDEIATNEAIARDKARLEQNKKDVQNKIRQLWDRAEELRKSYQFADAIDLVDRILAVDPTDDRALRWREDLLFYLSQKNQVDVRQKRESETVEALVETEEPLTVLSNKYKGRENYIRYPDAKEWKDLTERRRAFMKAVQAEPKAVAETRRRLSEEIDLDFEKTSLDNVLRYIGEVQRGLNIVIDPDITAAGTDLSTIVVDLKVKRVSIESVLNLILGNTLGYKVESGYILITTKEKMQQNLPMSTYPVQDLIAPVPDFGAHAPRFEINAVTANAATGGGGGAGGTLFGAGGAGTGVGGAGAGSTMAGGETLGPEQLLDIIKRTVNQASDPQVAGWQEEGGVATIEFINGMLVVTQTRRGHERIQELLDKLRRERAIMISVEARFAEVSDDFLQDITFDVDVAFASAANGSRFGSGFQAGANPVQLAGTQAAAFNTLPALTGLNGLAAQTGQPIIVQNNSSGIRPLLNLGTSPLAALGANEGGLTASGVFLDDIQVGFLLRAIQADIRSTLLQAPRLMLFNGQRSYISMATVVTYVSDIEPVVAEAAVGWRPTIAAIPVGVTLDVRATVSADRRYVQMDLRPQLAGTPTFTPVVISAAVPGGGIATSTIQLPTVAVQDLQTTINVPDGGTVLLGGLRRFTETEAEMGAPVLSKIPLLKRLFDNRGTFRHANNQMILVRPKIIIQAEEEQKLGYDEF